MELITQKKNRQKIYQIRSMINILQTVRKIQ